MDTQYDEIPDMLSLSTTLPYREDLEKHSFFKALGDVTGLSVLDLASGDGIYSRRILARGARRVVGLDISRELIERARELQGSGEPNLEYVVGDAADLQLGTFDVVTAVHLLHYAETRPHLSRMAAAIHGSLVPGGRFVTVTMDSEFDSQKPNVTRYGITMRRPEEVSEGEPVQLEIHTDPPFTIHFQHWTRATYQKVFEEAGFKQCRWIAMEVSPAGTAQRGEAFWGDYLRNPHAVIFACERP